MARLQRDFNSYVAGQFAGREADFSSVATGWMENAEPLPADYIRRVAPHVRQQLSGTNVRLDEVRIVEADLPPDERGTTIGDKVVVIDPDVWKENTYDKVVTHEIGHLIQKDLLGAEAYQARISLEGANYSQSQTPDPGRIPKVGTVPLAGLDLISPHYTLEGTAERFGIAVVTALEPEAPDPAHLFSPLFP